MAGYVFSLDNLDSLELYTRSGVYATKLIEPSGSWKAYHEGTFADYSTMQAGDNIYFFIKRKIYGIGILIDLDVDCKFFNFPKASESRNTSYRKVKKNLLWDEGEISVNQRCICVFKPDPYFFKLGVDMDDVLSSNPAAFKMLRAFWKVSFIKFDDEENQAFRDIILKRNQSTLLNPRRATGVFPFKSVHNQILTRLSKEDYTFGTGVPQILAGCADGDYLRHEMAIEAGILHQLSIKDHDSCEVFGDWDYLSHQVIASPFKPIDYMDKMDLFGYSYVPKFKPTKSRFIVGEIKKDAASIEDVDQLLKYVDWVRDEYCFGDYSMITAFLVTYDFSQDVVQHARHVGLRRYVSGVRPAQSLEWDNLKLVSYSFNSFSEKIDFSLVG
ncbi:hypothetical protein ACFLUU_00700 [Chloroflexota bacterium]